MRARLVKFRQLSQTDPLLLLEAGFYLTCVQLALRVVPFQSLMKLLDKPLRQAPCSTCEIKREIAHHVASAILSVKSMLPWHSTCMGQAVAGYLMLRRRHIHSKLYLGARLNEMKEFEAHAWLSCANEIMIGGETSDQFEIFGSFPQD